MSTSAKVRQDLMTTALDKCKAAIEAGDKEEALKQAQAIWDEWRPLHDLYVDLSGLLATYIRDHLGDKAVEEAWRFVGEQTWKPFLMQMKATGSTELLTSIYAQFLRAHGHRFTADRKSVV